MLEKLICKFETKEKDKLNIYEIKERSFNMGSDLVNKTEKDFESTSARADGARRSYHVTHPPPQTPAT